VTEDVPVTPELVLQAYTAGYFPMARSQKGRNLYWFNPETRAMLPLDEMGAFHISRSLRKFLRNTPLTATIDADFPAVIRACADNRRDGRDDTWINKEIMQLYTDLHEQGFAHSIEIWEHNPNSPTRGQQAEPALSQRSDVHLSASRRERDNQIPPILVGGLYGVSIGGAFFGESMFSTRTNASKMALVTLVQHLQSCGYTLLDAQFENDHLTQFGFRAIEREDYLARLRKALSIAPNPSSRF
jgi:leucyl/phenylalanyl-tRNA---protein transferase